jgi:hypothetical protein
MAKNDNITKDPAKAGHKGGTNKKGKKHKITLLKDAIGVDRTERILKNIERNIDEFIRSGDKRTRLLATKAFVDYYKPKRSVAEVNVKGTINFNVNSKIAGKQN